MPSDAVVVDKAMLRYVKMLNNAKLSVSAVRQRMVADGLPGAPIDAFFTAGISTSLRTEEQIQLAVEEEASSEKAVDLSKYEKWVQVGMAEGAIRQKMRQDRIPQEVIEKFFA